MTPPRILDALDKRIDWKLKAFIIRRRYADRSWRLIAWDIRDRYGVEVDGLTVKRWMDRQSNGSK